MTNINFRMSDGAQFSIETSESISELTIGKLKELISGPEKANASPSALKLVYRGKILKDENVLETYGFEDGHTIHVVRSRTAGSSPGTGSTGSTSQPNTGGGTQGMQSPLNSGQSGMGSMQSMMQNPEAMSNMMNNPMMQALTEDPEMLRGIIESSPQMRQMMNSNPELARAMRDPETLRNAMRAARDPAYMREMMRHQDVAMANIQNMPGGFDAIRRMYEEVQEPLESGMQESAQQMAEDPLGTLSGNPRQRRNNHETAEEEEDSSQPIPNPWGGSSQTNRSQGACSMLPLRSRACWVSPLSLKELCSRTSCA
eukprot:gb/GECG01013558.1/.p1 GENE.gb/GECG01013558.1/~~gb/GECG01013558.1/.p1  ORF type:complete len:314 (+),score=41.63 gb/GECG01013558.1/:1-942(+)